MGIIYYLLDIFQEIPQAYCLSKTPRAGCCLFKLNADQPASDEARRGGMMGLQLMPPKLVLRNNMPAGFLTFNLGISQKVFPALNYSLALNKLHRGISIARLISLYPPPESQQTIFAPQYLFPLPSRQSWLL